MRRQLRKYKTFGQVLRNREITSKMGIACIAISVRFGNFHYRNHRHHNQLESDSVM